MAMLAEPRRRKNYVLTPRGKPLYDGDDCKFGNKMLEKMGWSKGKGLGAKESGDTDFVRVNFKNDAGGLGFEKRDDQWTQHEHGFNGLLQSLNANNGDEPTEAQEDNDRRDETDDEGFQTVGFGFKPEKKNEKKKVKVSLSGESLEEKSKNSKARVHYKKFTRGKDISQYSEKDLANIFGKKALDIDVNVATNVEEDSEENKAEKFTENKSLSIADYFKQKMEKKKEVKKEKSCDTVSVVETIQTDCAQVLKESTCSVSDYFKRKMVERKLKQKGFRSEVLTETVEFVKMEETTETPKQNEESNDEEPARKKRKKDKKSSKKVEDLEELPATYFPAEVVKQPVETNDEEVLQKKRKKSKKLKEDNANEIEVPAINFPFEGLTKEEKVGNEQQNDDEQKLKKHKKDKKGSKNDIVKEALPETFFPVACEKRKKKKKNENAILNEDNSQSNEVKVVTNNVDRQQYSHNKTAVITERQETDKSVSNSTVSVGKLSDLQVSVELQSSSKLKKMEKKPVDVNVYVITAFSAEKFRRVVLDRFQGSNLGHFEGYAFDKDTKLIIRKNINDERRILEFWKGSLNKYSETRGKMENPKKLNEKHNNIDSTIPSKRPKRKLKTVLARHKRRSAFKVGI